MLKNILIEIVGGGSVCVKDDHTTPVSGRFNSLGSVGISPWTMLVSHPGPCWYLTLAHVGISPWPMLVSHPGPCWYLTLDHVGISPWTMLVYHPGPCSDLERRLVMLFS